MNAIEPPRRYTRTERVSASISPERVLDMCIYARVCVCVCICSLNTLAENSSLQVLHGAN